MNIFILCIIFSLFFLSGAIFFVIFPTFTHYLCIFTLKNARFWALACNKDARLFIKTHLYEKTSTYVGINHIGIIDSQCADRLRVAQGATRACRFGQRDDWPFSICNSDFCGGTYVQSRGWGRYAGSVWSISSSMAPMFPLVPTASPKLLALMRSLAVLPPINSNPMPIIALWVSHL